MNRLETTISIERSLGDVYNYLKNRYNSEQYQKVSKEIKGYLPEIKILADNDANELTFEVAAVDAITKWRSSGWKWGYVLNAQEAGHTSITIWYEWSSMLNITTMGTAQMQAANEITDTILALEALQV